MLARTMPTTARAWRSNDAREAREEAEAVLDAARRIAS